MTYQEQIKHPKWQKKRLEVLKLHKFTCQSCRAKDEELHVHHPVYKRGAMIWEYDKKELECLCHRCHKDAHAIDEKIKKALAVCKDKQRVLEFILSLSVPLSPPKVLPSSDEADNVPDYIAALERERREANKRRKERDRKDEEDTAKVYSQYPELMPSPDDTEAISAEKFFRTMRLLMEN